MSPTATLTRHVPPPVRPTVLAAPAGPEGEDRPPKRRRKFHPSTILFTIVALPTAIAALPLIGLAFAIERFVKGVQR